MAALLKDQNVLVTGAGGSIAQNFAGKSAALNLKKSFCLKGRKVRCACDRAGVEA